MFQILVVEDNENLRKMMMAKLKNTGYSVFAAANGDEALQISDSHHIDLYICDIMMPVMDGFTFIESIRSAGVTTPILIVTAKDEFEDKEKGFGLGSDDYMVKPIDLKEMLLRVSALLRRAQITSEQKIEIGDIVLDYKSFTITMSGESETLPRKEFLLLFKLLSYPNQIFTRYQLLDEIWGMDVDVDERTVDSHIKKLRKRLDGRPEFRIVTLRGLGYKAEKLI